MTGAPQGFKTTARVMAYTGGSAAVFNAIPVIGMVIGAIWGIVISIIGLARAHEVPTQQAATAVILPILLAALVGFFCG
jgi:hypothetical protein